MAAAVSAVWLAGAAVLLAVLGIAGALWLAIAVAVALPVVAIWFAALLARQSASLRAEAERQSRTDRAPVAAQRSRLAMPAPRPEPRPDLGPPAPMRLTPADGARARPPAAADAAPGPPLPPVQPPLPLGFAEDGPRVSLADLTRALDFPDSPEDQDGFRALHRALRDPGSRRLMQAGQDILTLLSQEGIYMDDLPPARARAELWRRFAAGERGADLGRLGGIRDRSSLALTASRLRSDTVFRDAAHHFLRLFDGMLAETAPEATDAQLAALTDTRSARAFMLIGRAAGTFD